MSPLHEAFGWGPLEGRFSCEFGPLSIVLVLHTRGMDEISMHSPRARANLDVL